MVCFIDSNALVVAEVLRVNSFKVTIDIYTEIIEDVVYEVKSSYICDMGTDIREEVRFFNVEENGLFPHSDPGIHRSVTILINKIRKVKGENNGK